MCNVRLVSCVFFHCNGQSCIQLQVLRIENIQPPGVWQCYYSGWKSCCLYVSSAQIGSPCQCLYSNQCLWRCSRSFLFVSHVQQGRHWGITFFCPAPVRSHVTLFDALFRHTFPSNFFVTLFFTFLNIFCVTTWRRRQVTYGGLHSTCYTGWLPVVVTYQ